MASGIQSGIKDFITYQSHPILSVRFPPSLDIFIKVIKTKEMMIMPGSPASFQLLRLLNPFPDKARDQIKK